MSLCVIYNVDWYIGKHNVNLIKYSWFTTVTQSGLRIFILIGQIFYNNSRWVKIDRKILGEKILKISIIHKLKVLHFLKYFFLLWVVCTRQISKNRSNTRLPIFGCICPIRGFIQPILWRELLKIEIPLFNDKK